MTYDIFQSCLLFPTELNPSECASWVQAVGSIVAIFIVVLVAIYQSNRQSEITRQAFLHQVSTANIGTAETIVELAKAAVRLQKHFKEKLNTQTALENAATYGLKGDMAMLHGLEQFCIQ